MVGASVRGVSRLVVSGIDIAIDAVAQETSTTIGAVGGYAVVVATALPELVVMLTSGYLAAMVGDIAVSHLSSVPGGPPLIDQHVLPGRQPGQTHAHICLLDHIAELRSILDALHADATHVTVDVTDGALQQADRAWSAQSQRPRRRPPAHQQRSSRGYNVEASARPRSSSAPAPELSASNNARGGGGPDAQDGLSGGSPPDDAAATPGRGVAG